MNRNPLILTIGFLIGIIVILLLFTFQVRKSEVVVITTFDLMRVHSQVAPVPAGPTRYTGYRR